MKIQISDAMREEVDQRPTVTGPPIECVTAKAIAAAIVEMLDPISNGGWPRHLREFVRSGAIDVRLLHVELSDAFNLLEMDSDHDLPLVNGLRRYFEWCGDREGGVSWGNV